MALPVPRFLKNFEGISFEMSTVPFEYTPIGNTVPHQPIVNGNRLIPITVMIATTSQKVPSAQTYRNEPAYRVQDVTGVVIEHLILPEITFSLYLESKCFEK